MNIFHLPSKIKWTDRIANYAQKNKSRIYRKKIHQGNKKECQQHSATNIEKFLKNMKFFLLLGNTNNQGGWGRS